MTKEFEILPTTTEEWFDKYQTLLEEINKKEDELAHLKKLNKKYFDLAEKLGNAEQWNEPFIAELWTDG